MSVRWPAFRRIHFLRTNFQKIRSRSWTPMSRMSLRVGQGARAWLRGARPGDATWRSSPCMCARPALGHLFASPTLPLPGASRWVGSAGGTCGCKESEAANAHTPGGEHRPLQPDTDDLQWEQELLETFNAKAPIAQSLGLRSTIPQPNPALDLGSCAAGAWPPVPCQCPPRRCACFLLSLICIVLPGT